MYVKGKTNNLHPALNPYQARNKTVIFKVDFKKLSVLLLMLFPVADDEDATTTGALPLAALAAVVFDSVDMVACCNLFNLCRC